MAYKSHNLFPGLQQSIPKSCVARKHSEQLVQIHLCGTHRSFKVPNAWWTQKSVDVLPAVFIHVFQEKTSKNSHKIDGNLWKIHVSRPPLPNFWICYCSCIDVNSSNHLHISMSSLELLDKICSRSVPGGSQGVQLLDWSNQSQVRAIRLRWFCVTWHPSIWCWSLWVG